MRQFICTGLLFCLLSHLGVITDTCGGSLTQDLYVMPDATLGSFADRWESSYTQGFCYVWCHTWGLFFIHGVVLIHRASVMSGVTLGGNY